MNYLPHIETHICDHCNLNCKACNNYSPFVKGRSVASLERWSEDIRRLNEIYWVGRILLLGGEPLLEPDLTKEFIRTTRQNAPLSEVYLLTNGLLIPSMKEDFWETLINNNVTLNITAYVPATARIMPAIWSTLELNGVDYTYRKAVVFSKRLTLVPEGDENLNGRFCGSSGCHYLRDGYLFKCPDASLVKHFDKVAGTSLESKCGISLDEAEKDPIGVLDRLNTPIDLCRFCDVRRFKGIPWEPVSGTPDIKDWLV